LISVTTLRKTEARRKGSSARLLGVNPSDSRTREFQLSKLETFLGSEEQNDLVICDPTVSRKHAKITCLGGRYQIADLGSTNGTFVNGRRVNGSMRLRQGDEVRLGGVKFVFVPGKTKARSGPKRNPWRVLRTIGEITLAACVLGFATAQYLIYRHDQARQQAQSSQDRPTEHAPRQAPTARTTGVTRYRKALVQPTPQARIARSDPSALTTSAWLQRVNYWRATAKLPPVTEDPALSDGERKHARYIVRNFAPVIKAGVDLGDLMHTEDPTNPWYSREGFNAAKLSALNEWTGSDLPANPFWAIDNWMTAPFHRLSILNPGLHRVSYGEFCEAGVCAAGLNVISDADPLPLKPKPLASPIMFPPQDVSVKLRSFDGEWPNPLSACAGYTTPAGLPITLQFGPLTAPAVSAYSLTEDDKEIAACLFVADNYTNADPVAQQRGADTLKDFGAVVLVPRSPLQAGHTYAASITVITADKQTRSWSFTIGQERENAAREEDESG
jgi:pSer/pThr/pTyr-binding forkhead associated (FHA) protein